MGNWQLEVFKMALYVSFPVALFHYFNQPQNFEEQVKTMVQRTNSPEEEEFKKEIKKVIKQMQEEEEARMLKSLNDKQTI